MLKISVSGGDALGETLKRLSELPGIEPALDEAAGTVAAEAAEALRSVAPAAQAERLAASLEISKSRNGSAIRIGTPSRLARALEFGSLNRPPKPWLEPALRTAYAPVVARLKLWFTALTRG